MSLIAAMATRLAANGFSRRWMRRPISSILSAGRQLDHYSSAPPGSVPITNLSPLETEKLKSHKGSVGRSLTSLKDAELEKFASMSETWWDAEGPFKPLHAMNPTRLAFLRSTLCRHFGRDPLSPRPLDGLRVADIGCGGGILSEPLARMGATVTGVDAVDKNIKIARIHADKDPITSEIEYCCTTAEALVEQKREFDAVISLEVIEHVANPAEFCQSLSALTISNGATVISTVNRSIRGYAATIVIAEYILQWLPIGTHQWSSFITPEELVLILQRASVSVKEIAGFVYNPLTGKWLLSDDISVNYIAYGSKEGRKTSKLTVPIDSEEVQSRPQTHSQTGSCKKLVSDRYTMTEVGNLQKQFEAFYSCLLEGEILSQLQDILVILVLKKDCSSINDAADRGSPIQ
ncbi:unnamed protein product [Rhodiola kirilowii]